MLGRSLLWLRPVLWRRFVRPPEPLSQHRQPTGRCTNRCVSGQHPQTSLKTFYSSAPQRHCSANSTWEKDRKSTRLNSSHANISYAVFCLKKKTSHTNITYTFCCLKNT